MGREGANAGEFDTLWGIPWMETDLEKLEEEALKLTPGERAALVQRLLASLEEDAGIEEAWATEVERRIAEAESGAVPLIPIAEALAQVRAAEDFP